MDSQGYMNGALQTLKLFHGPDSLYVCCPEGKASYLALFDIQNPCKNPISQSPSVLFFRTLAPIMHIRLPRIQNKTKNRQKKEPSTLLVFLIAFAILKLLSRAGRVVLSNLACTSLDFLPV